VRCNWEHPGETTHWELGEHHGKLIENLENIPVCLRTKVFGSTCLHSLQCLVKRQSTPWEKIVI